MKKEVLVGSVFLAAVALTLFGTVVVSGLDLLARKATWKVELKDLNGLEAGDDVRVLGHLMGVVDRIDFDRTQYVFRLTLRMQPDAPIHDGYRITVRDTTALGGKHLYVEPGTPARPPADPAKLVGETRARDLMTAISDAADEIKEIAAKIGRGEGSLGRLIAEDGLYRNLEAAAGSLKTIAARIEKGQGAVGRLINEDDVYVQLRNLVTRLNEGDSALAKLMKDESGSLVDDLRTASANIRSITAKMDKGVGTVGLLINDGALYQDASGLLAGVRSGKGIAGMLVTDETARKNVGDVFDNLQVVTREVREGRGTVGRLVTDDELYKDAAAFAKHMNRAAAKVDDGTGTIGKLINDPEVYERVKRLLARAIDTIENGRDSAPVAAVTSFLFGPFQ